MDNIYMPKTYKITDKKKFTADTVLFRISSGMDPEPGQFVEASYHGVGECPISVCSYSTQYMELLIRDMGNVTKKLTGLEKGSSIALRGPYGKGYPMKDMIGKSVVIVAGGTGVAPPRSVIEYIAQHRIDYHDVRIFLGFRNPKEILFKDDIEKWSKQFKLALTVDQCADPSFTGKVCFVTDALGDADITRDNTVVLLCGPPIMMKIAADKLGQKGFEDSQVYMSFERHMKCGLGKCGHCVIAGKYVCKDGPVFSYATARGFYD